MSCKYAHVPFIMEYWILVMMASIVFITLPLDVHHIRICLVKTLLGKNSIGEKIPNEGKRVHHSHLFYALKLLPY